VLFHPPFRKGAEFHSENFRRSLAIAGNAKKNSRAAMRRIKENAKKR
jgi:hypothetical protein